MQWIFEEKGTEAMIFVDASNTFNSLNMEATSVNSQSVCPSLAPVIIKTYKNPSSLFVGREAILSLHSFLLHSLNPMLLTQLSLTESWQMELCTPCYQFRTIKLKSLAATGICYQDSILSQSNWPK